MTYYDILEISENASEEVIRMAYKALAKKYHPDVYKGDPKEAGDKMKKINEAFEVLSNEQKRKQYDDCLRNKRNATTENKQRAEYNQSQKDDTKVKKEIKFPSGAKSGLIIGLLSFLSFTQVLHPYIENTELYDYAFGFGFRDFALLNLIMLVVPLFVFAFRKTNTMKNIKLLCLFNSIGVWVVSLILFACEITISMSIGWILAVIHYFVNKHLLLQLAKKDYNSKMKICITSAVTLSLLAVVIVGTLLTNGIITKDDEPNNQNDNITNNSDYTEENKQSFSEWTEEKKEKSDFLDECIVFVIDGFDDYYYTYDEMVYVTQKMDDYTFWAYNKEQAIALNYVASNVNVSNGWSSEKANFLDERIVFVIDGFGSYYYTYDEMIAVTQQMDEYEFWAYNTEQAIAKGYKHH